MLSNDDESMEILGKFTIKALSELLTPCKYIPLFINLTSAFTILKGSDNRTAIFYLVPARTEFTSSAKLKLPVFESLIRKRQRQSLPRFFGGFRSF